MATSYPDRTNARGIWRITDITRNIKTEGTFPGAFGQRGLFGGAADPGASNIIDYITISTTGNATDFGDLSTARSQHGQASSITRGLWIGGSTHPAHVNVIDYVYISTLGNAADFKES